MSTLQSTDPVMQAATNPEVISAMAEFYREFDQSIAAHRPTCINRGACCRFGSYGHRLYVTPLELAYFRAGHNRHEDGADKHTRSAHNLAVIPPRGAGNDRCPYQQNGLCTAREGRPVGCRVFFCESEGAGWQEQLSEKALRTLKELHLQFKLPYQYTEWLGALSELSKPRVEQPLPLVDDGYANP